MNSMPSPFLCGEYFVRFPPGCFFLPDDHGLEFYINARENSTNQSRERACILRTSWHFMLLPGTVCIKERVANEHTHTVS